MMGTEWKWWECLVCGNPRYMQCRFLFHAMTVGTWWRVIQTLRGTVFMLLLLVIPYIHIQPPGYATACLSLILLTWYRFCKTQIKYCCLRINGSLLQDTFSHCDTQCASHFEVAYSTYNAWYNLSAMWIVIVSGNNDSKLIICMSSVMKELFSRIFVYSVVVYVHRYGIHGYRRAGCYRVTSVLQSRGSFWFSNNTL